MQNIQKEGILDLNHYRNRLEVLKGTILQIEKDLNIDLPALKSEDPLLAYQELFSLIVPLTDEMLKGERIRLKSLLYLIDISEKKLQRSLMDQTTKNEAEIIAEMLIEREIQKVAFRIFYSEQLKK